MFRAQESIKSPSSLNLFELPRDNCERVQIAIVVTAIVLTILGGLAFQITYPDALSFMNLSSVKIGLVTGGVALVAITSVSIAIKRYKVDEGRSETSVESRSETRTEVIVETRSEVEKASPLAQLNKFAQATEEDLKVSRKPFPPQGKLVSPRTVECRNRLVQTLKEKGKILGEAIDNGDCFFDAFAQSINKLQNSNHTANSLRLIVSDQANELHKATNGVNWINDKLRRDYALTYKTYLTDIQFGSDFRVGPYWGMHGVCGRLLSDYFRVNLVVYDQAASDPLSHEDLLNAQEMDPNFVDEIIYSEGQTDYPTNLSNPQTVEMGLYPGHYMPVFTL